MRKIKKIREQTKIEVFSLVFSLISFFFCLFDYGFDEYTTFYVFLSFMSGLLFTLYWLADIKIFLILLSFYLVSFIVVIYSEGGVSPSINMIVTLISILIISLKLKLKLSIPLNILILLISLKFPFLSYQWRESFFSLISKITYIIFISLYIYHKEEHINSEQTIIQQEETIKRLTRVNQSFMEYLENVEVESAEKERKMITRELHDSIGYAMTNISNMMKSASYIIKSSPKKLLEFCIITQSLAESTQQDVRATLYRLRDIKKETIDNPNIFFSNLCLDFQKATNVKTECFVLNLPHHLNPHVMKTFYRIIQVGFINALRHGHSTHIRLFLTRTEKTLEFVIWNNLNKNFIKDRIREGIGIKGISERISLFSGSIDYGYVVDGFELNISFPLEYLKDE